MAKKLHAIDYLAKVDKYPPREVCAVFGDEPFLRRQVILQIRADVLGGDDADFSLSTFEGRKAELRDVLEELSTLAMFGGGRRLAVVEEADEFIRQYRGELEDYVASPYASGVLVLDVKSFPANTRLYKAVSAAGLAIDCASPTSAKLTRWLAVWAKRAHAVQLPPASAEMLVELIGPELGLLDQELAKLALVVGENKSITPESITRSAGGWRAKTTWEMLDAALDGNAPEAILQLNRLLASGEQPIAILAQISASLRRLAAAARVVVQTETAGRKPQIRRALQQAEVRPFVLEKAEGQLRRLGRERGLQLYDWLLQADLDLKGASALPPRLILERLVIQLAAPREAVALRG